ncbi:hypothetical protein ACJX0J_037375, partial [Zea mays]
FQRGAIKASIIQIFHFPPPANHAGPTSQQGEKDLIQRWTYDYQEAAEQKENAKSPLGKVKTAISHNLYERLQIEGLTQMAILNGNLYDERLYYLYLTVMLN